MRVEGTKPGIRKAENKLHNHVFDRSYEVDRGRETGKGRVMVCPSGKALLCVWSGKVFLQRQHFL